MTPKIDSTNVLYKDLTEQPDSKMIAIFFIGASRGALAYDNFQLRDGVVTFMAGKEDRIVGMFPTDLVWLAIARDRVNLVSNRDYMVKQVDDIKQMNEALEKLRKENPEVAMEQPDEPIAPATMPNVGHYL